MNVRRLLILFLVGILLVGLPLAVRTALVEFGSSRYQPPKSGLADLAATPEPTSTAAPAPQDVAVPAAELPSGPIVVDLAHFNLVGPSQFQPLAARLATRGISLRFWINPMPGNAVDKTNLSGLPDQSADLAVQLRDASALVIVSPLFLWKETEIAPVEKFVADGGRLLLISDPDIPEVPDYYIHDVNKLGEPFGVVFSDDYLYDLTRNDRNFTHVFQGEFLDRAAELSGKTIVLYGAHSLGGPVVSQVRTADTTLSSLRTGLTIFTTVAIGGQPLNGTAGRVLAMGDFDVLTDPYVSRYDNEAMLGFVADFLAGAQREQHIADFPAYLGPRVALAFGPGMPLDALLLAQASQLQQNLQDGGRTMDMISPASFALTGTVALTRSTTLTATSALSVPNYTDLIYVATFETANRETTLLSNAGIRLTEVAPTPSADEATPSATAKSAGTSEASTTTPTPEATPTPTATPQATRVLETGFSPQLVADDSILIMRSRLGDGQQVTAVLGSDLAAIDGALNRLLSRDFANCIIYPDLVLCPFTVQVVETPVPAEEAATSTPEATPEQPPETTEPVETPPPAESRGNILVVDDNRTAAQGEASEAALFESTLTDMGFAPTSWFTARDGDPTADDLTGYNWVIWSSGAYQGEDVKSETMTVLALFLEMGGRLTVSGRTPVLGKSDRAASVVADVVLTDQLPALVVGLSGTPIQLAPDLPPATPLDVKWGPDAKVVMRRGQASADADAPVMVALEGTAQADGRVQRAAVLGIALNWLPDADARQLVRNMAAWMLE
jgi:hypothetical protein